MEVKLAQPILDGSRLYAINGQDNANRSLDLIEIYDFATDDWTILNNSSARTPGCWRPGYTSFKENVVLVGGSQAK